MEPLNLRRVQYFLAVARCGTVSGAARELHLAQPALSRQLKIFETELGVKLFAPKGNRLVLTPGGTELLPMLRHLHSRAGEVQLAARDVAAGAAIRLRFAAAPATIRTVLAPFIATLEPLDPLITTHAASHDGIYDILYGQADAVISPVPPLAELSRLRIVDAPLRAYIVSSHPLAGRSAIPAIDLVEHRVAISPTTSTSRVELDTVLARMGAGYRDLLECADGVTLHALAITGRAVGVAAEPPSQDLPGVERLIAAPILDDQGRPMAVPLHAAWLPDHHAAATILGVAARLRVFGHRAFGVEPD